MVEDFFANGWIVFDPEPAVKSWADHAREHAFAAMKRADMRHWHQCEGTWFVGVDALQNDASGRVAGGPVLVGAAVDFIDAHCGGWPALHRGQVSAMFPGYPKPRSGETDAGFRYRRDRDAAHVDGVMGLGQPKRRFVQEPHAFILGLPLTQSDADAAPLVVWEGSHLIIQKAFRSAFSAADDAQALSSIDVTEIYQAARREVFETCPRLSIHAGPGAAYVVHRLALHGVAGWAAGAQAQEGSRVIAYFRPAMAGGAAAWVAQP